MRLVPLLRPYDGPAVPPIMPAPTPAAPVPPSHLVKEPVMSLSCSVKITSVELREIFARLQPHLPRYLLKAEPNPSGWGMRYEFTPFTGREEKPATPASSYADPKLSYVPESENAAEHAIRAKARTIVCDLYDQARREWGNAAYIADLKTAVGDAPARWKTYQHEIKALEAAYGYLRTPEAAGEWQPAISRLIDAQDRARAAAAAFDTRGEEIARVHRKHLYADLSHNAALKAAGYPEAADWHIVDADDYRGYYSLWAPAPLQEMVRRLTEEQDAHIAKVGRLSGTATG